MIKFFVIFLALNAALLNASQASVNIIKKNQPKPVSAGDFLAGIVAKNRMDSFNSLKFLRDSYHSKDLSNPKLDNLLLQEFLLNGAYMQASKVAAKIMKNPQLSKEEKGLASLLTAIIHLKKGQTEVAQKLLPKKEDGDLYGIVNFLHGWVKLQQGHLQLPLTREDELKYSFGPLQQTKNLYLLNEVLKAYGSYSSIENIAIKNIVSQSLVFMHLWRYIYGTPQYDLIFGNIYEDMETPAKAKSYYERIRPTDAQYLSARLRLFFIKTKAGERPEKFIRELNALATDEQKKQRVLKAIADAFANNKEFKKSARAYSRTIKHAGADASWNLFFARGIAYERSGFWRKAEADFLKALELEENQPYVLNYVAYSWLIRGENVELATKKLEEAHERQPGDAAIMDSLGWAYFLDGRYEEALGLIETAVNLRPSDSTLYDHLGDVYYKLGRTREAKHMWQRSLYYGPTEEGAKEKLERKLQEGL